MLGRFVASNACFVEAVRLDPKNAMAWYYLGTHGGGSLGGKQKTAVECFIEAIHFDPKLYLAWINLGLEGGGIVHFRDRTDIECVSDALRINSKYARAWYFLGHRGVAPWTPYIGLPLSVISKQSV